MRNKPIPLDSVETVRRGWLLARAGEDRWLITEKTAGRIGLSAGSMVVPAELDGVSFKDQLPGARADTERYLSRSEHTSKQLRDYLRRRMYHSSVIREIDRWTSENGLVDDRRYAELYVASHSRRSPMGNYRLRMELRKRGVSSETVDLVLSGREEMDIYQQLVMEIRNRYGGLERQKAVRRASAFLSRRGFGFHLVREVVEEALDSEREPGD